MNDHVDDLFTHTGEQGQDASEAFDTQLDYRSAQERKNGAEHASGRGLIGSFALLISEEKAGQWQAKFDSWRASRRAKRAQRKQAKAAEYSLSNIGFEDGTPLVHEPSVAEYRIPPNTQQDAAIPPRPVVGAPGVYRSNFSDNQPKEQAPPSGTEFDEIMAGAVQRARAKLGELPLQTIHVPAQRQPEPEDAQLLARLEDAYRQPAQEPDRRNYKGRHALPTDHDDEHLTSTSA